MYHFLALNANHRHLISVIYNLINSINSDTNATLKDTWEQDFGVIITEDLWHNILNQVRTSSICARNGLMQCKILFLAHLTNAKLAKFFPVAACNRCKLSPANHIHILDLSTAGDLLV